MAAPTAANFNANRDEYENIRVEERNRVRDFRFVIFRLYPIAGLFTVFGAGGISVITDYSVRPHGVGRTK
jgi:hypothetical protein